MYYVSYIREYPIYEPAEGGYYYAGEHVESCREFSTWKKANRYYQKMRKWFFEEYGYCLEELKRINDFQCGGVSVWHNPFISYYGRYVGEGARVELTRQKPEEHGWHPYE